MKTKAVHWYENLLVFLFAWVKASAVVFATGVVAFLLVFQGQAFSIQVNGIPYWYSAFILAPIMGFLVGSLLWFGEKRIRLFDYEKKAGLVPYIENIAVALVNRNVKNIVDWRENKEFEATIKPVSLTDDRYCFATSGKDLYLVKNSVFVKYFKNTCYNQGVKGVWTWKWNGDFIELVLVKPVITSIKQLEFDFGA